MEVHKKIHTNFDDLQKHQRDIEKNMGISDFHPIDNGGYILYYSFDIPPKISDLDALVATKPITVFIEINDQNLPLEQTNIGKIPKNRRKNLSWKGCYYTILPNEIFFFYSTNHYDVSKFRLDNGLNFKEGTGNPLGGLLKMKLKL